MKFDQTLQGIFNALLRIGAPFWEALGTVLNFKSLLKFDRDFATQFSALQGDFGATAKGLRRAHFLLESPQGGAPFARGRII